MDIKKAVWSLALLTGAFAITKGWEDGSGLLVIIGFMIICAGLLVTGEGDSG